MRRVPVGDLDFGDDYVVYEKGKPFTGVAYDTRPNGSLWSEVTYGCGLRHGVSRSWHDNGQLMSQDHYKLARADGLSEEWHHNGRHKLRRLYELANIVEEQEWDEAGKLIRDYHIDPGSDEYRRLERDRAQEPQRVQHIYETYGHPDEPEG